jgi:hypothetical protein
LSDVSVNGINWSKRFGFPFKFEAISRILVIDRFADIFGAPNIPYEIKILLEEDLENKIIKHFKLL